MTQRSHQVPLWLKVLCTLYVLVLIWLYQNTYGPANFLWFCDIAFFVTIAALWMESALLASMAAITVLLPDIAWTVAFCCRLLVGIELGGITGYMFNPAIPLAVRAISLFHFFLPVLLLWLIHRLGYDRRAWRLQTLGCWAVLLATFRLTNPKDNINHVFGPGSQPQHRIPPLLYLLIVMWLIPLLVYFPTHLALLRMFPRRKRTEG